MPKIDQRADGDIQGAVAKLAGFQGQRHYGGRFFGDGKPHGPTETVQSRQFGILPIGGHQAVDGFQLLLDPLLYRLAIDRLRPGHHLDAVVSAHGLPGEDGHVGPCFVVRAATGRHQTGKAAERRVEAMVSHGYYHKVMLRHDKIRRVGARVHTWAQAAELQHAAVSC